MPLLSNRVISKQKLDQCVIVVDDHDNIFDFTRDLSDVTVKWDDFVEGEYPILDEVYFDSDSDSDMDFSNWDCN